MMQIGIFGAGNLASALVQGLSSRRRGVYKIWVNDINEAKAQALADSQEGVQAGTAAELAAQASILILAVKPAHVAGLLDSLAALPGFDQRQETLLVSVAAGLGLDYYERRLPGRAVVRTMPNTSSRVGQGMTGLARGAHVSDSQAEAAADIFQALGPTLWLSDAKMDALMAVSGSGPAYFYFLAETMARAGEQLGLSPQEAAFLAGQTLIGAGRMLEQADEGGERPSPAALRAAVTSPQGTTEAAIETMRQAGLEEAVQKGMQACVARGRQMEEELRKAP